MAAKAKTVRTVTVDGITLDVDIARLEDPRFSYAIGKSADDTLSDGEKLVWYNRMLDMLYGDDAYNIMCQLADGGLLTIDRWSEFFTATLEAVGEKNS